MNLFFVRAKRVFAFALALVLLTGTNLGLVTTVSAAGAETTSLYTLIGAEYYPDNADAQGILASGALKGDKMVEIRFPGAGDELITLSEGTLLAKNFSSNYDSQNWLPFLCHINGEFAGYPSSTTPLAVPGEGNTQVEVSYRLLLEGYDDVPELAGSIMVQGKYQLHMLNKLSADTYMGYMAQLKKSLVTMLSSVLSPNSAIVFEGLVLNENPQKDKALKSSFSKITAQMAESCYDSNNLLKIYNLLNEYKTNGLIYYYRNSEAFITEINVLSEYLTALLAADPSNGLTAEDKMAGLEALMTFANGIKPGVAAYASYLPRLEEIMATVKSSLSSPNEAIDLTSSNLEKLVDTLENGSEFEVAVDYTSTCLTTTVSVELCNHIFDSEADADCNFCGGSRPDTSGSGTIGGDGTTGGGTTGGDGTTGDGTTGGGTTGGGETTGGETTGGGGVSDVTVSAVKSISQFQKCLMEANAGDVIKLSKEMTMSKDVSVNCSITIEGADKLDDTDHVLFLNSANAGIHADGALNVASSVDGYVPVKANNSYTYTLAEVSAPKTSGDVAGSKSEKFNAVRYLFLDLDPTNGMALDALRTSMAISELDGYTVTLSIDGNDGTGLVKTSDHLTVSAYNSKGVCISQITYVVIVMGDTNCNGKVNTSDATVTRNISMGKESSSEVRMASDVNFSGTLGAPKINSSDVSYMMAKWFAWDQDKYVSNMK